MADRHRILAVLRYVGIAVLLSNTAPAVLYINNLIDTSLLTSILIVSTISSAALILAPKLGEKHAEEEFESALPYIVLFLKIGLLSGLTPVDSLKYIAEATGNTLLKKMIRYVEYTGDPDEAISRVVGRISRTSTEILSTIFKSASYGEYMIKFLDNMYQVLIGERKSLIEKITSTINIMTTIYLGIGVFTPMFILVLTITASLVGMGFKNPLPVMASSIVITPLISILFAMYARKTLAKVLS